MSEAPQNPPSVQPRSDMDANLENQVKSLESQARAEQQARVQGNQAIWMMPDAPKWSGDLFDFDAMAAPFDRSVSNASFTDATSDASRPGTVGDMMITTLQIDYLACMERAFRARHTMRRPRAMLHAMGRKAGHGSDNGPLVQAVLEHIRGQVKINKGGGAN